MTAAPLQEFGTERDAAKVVGFPASKFREYVNLGSLPAPVRTMPDGTKVWDFVQLRAMMRGDAAKPNEDVEI